MIKKCQYGNNLIPTVDLSLLQPNQEVLDKHAQNINYLTQQAAEERYQ